MAGVRGAFPFRGSDGTAMVGWRNGEAGIPVVISNGLGTPPEAWPALIRSGSGYRIATYYHRGTGGSARPEDRSRIHVEDHLADLIALMDHEGIERAVIASWSIGVNVAFELARRHPERVAGMLVVAGIPGGSFASMFATVGVPKRLRYPVAIGVSSLARAIGPGLSALARALPMNDLVAKVIAHTGFMLPQAKPPVTKPALSEFFRNDFRWYFDLALAAARHEPMDVSFLSCPTTIVAGRWDSLTAAADVIDVARRVPHAELVQLPGSHFLPLEYPEEMARLLGELVPKCDLRPATDGDQVG